MPSFTPEQERAITTSGTNIIVSAGAGSGKTAVLTERVIRKLKNGIDINKILVLTFTKEAALEMKDRIRSSIKKEGLTKQLDYIDSAYITTFDSYALSIVKKYHYLLNVTNNISIIDSSLITVKKSKLIDDIFDSMYGKRDFESFINKFCVKDDAILKKAIIKLSNRMDLIIDKETFLKEYIDNYYKTKNINALVKEYKDYVVSLIPGIRESVYYLASLSSEKFENDLVVSFQGLMDSKTYEDVLSNIEVSIPRLPSGSEEETKIAKDELKTQVDKLKNLVRYKSDDELISVIKSTKKDASVIIELIRRLDAEINEFKFQNDKFEFIDIAKMAIKVVKENENIREELRSFYHEIMIDEYQDTNDLQEEFVKLIENNNVYVVGDIKQSIYRFRNANPNLFREKYINYQNNNGGVKIDLLKNFRSRSEVLDDINMIFNRIMDLSIGDAAYEESHQMVFGNTDYINKGKNEHDNHITVYNYDYDDNTYSKEEIEAFIIAHDIKKKMNSNYKVMNKKTGELQDLKYSDICIILDRMSSFNLFKKIFEYLKIPLTLYKDETLSENTDMFIIKNIIASIIKVHDKIYDKEFRYYMMSIMRSFLFNYSDDEIFKCFKNNNFYENDVFIKIKDLAKSVDEISVYELTSRIYKEFDIYNKSILKGNIDSSFVRYEYMLNLSESLTEFGYTIKDYLTYLEDLIKEKIEIRYPVNTRGSDSVKIMTIHKSKGLEFPLCYFSGYYKTFNKDDLKDMFMYDNDYGLIIPTVLDNVEPSFVKDLLINKFNKEEISEKIRLLYVALTRAREKMIIVIPNTEEYDNNSYLVSDYVRLKYNSFLKITNSIKNTLKNYTVNCPLNELPLTKEYDKINELDIEDVNNESSKIEYVENDIVYEKIEEKRFSKSSNTLITDSDRFAMEAGLEAHYKLEMEDFHNPVSDVVKDLVSKLGDIKNVEFYKEFEFIYNDDGIIRHGIIDLLVEGKNEIKIIDYKLSNIEDENYLKQLNGYKKYIELLTDKKVTIYLYSINKRTLKNLEV